jgi:hypothetical protein
MQCVLMMVFDRELQHKNTFIVIKGYDHDNGYNDYVVTYCMHNINTGRIKVKSNIIPTSLCHDRDIMKIK